MKDGIRSSLILVILRDVLMEPTTLRHWGYRFMPIAEYAESTSQIDYILKRNCLQSLSYSYPFKNNKIVNFELILFKIFQVFEVSLLILDTRELLQFCRAVIFPIAWVYSFYGETEGCWFKLVLKVLFTNPLAGLSA